MNAVQVRHHLLSWVHTGQCLSSKSSKLYGSVQLSRVWQSSKRPLHTISAPASVAISVSKAAKPCKHIDAVEQPSLGSEAACLQAPVASKATQGTLLARSSVSLLFSHPAAAVQSEPTTSSSQSLPAQPERTTLSLPTALSLYELTDSKLFTELQTDTRCLVTWNATKIVITFRGTASVKNAKADLQVSTT